MEKIKGLRGELAYLVARLLKESGACREDSKEVWLWLVEIQAVDESSLGVAVGKLKSEGVGGESLKSVVKNFRARQGNRGESRGRLAQMESPDE